MSTTFPLRYQTLQKFLNKAKADADAKLKDAQEEFEVGIDKLQQEWVKKYKEPKAGKIQKLLYKIQPPYVPASPENVAKGLVTLEKDHRANPIYHFAKSFKDFMALYKLVMSNIKTYDILEDYVDPETTMQMSLKTWRNMNLDSWKPPKI